MRISLSLIGALVAVFALAQAHAHSAGTAVQTHRLSNGVTLIVSEDPTAALVSMVSLYRVGHRDDPPGRAGLAHLLEHVLVEAPVPGPGSQSGRPAFLKGVTDVDFTTYKTKVPAGDVGLALWKEAVRLTMFDHRDMVEAILPRARDSVINEDRQRDTRHPERAISLLPYRSLFPVGHPYHGVADRERAGAAGVGAGELAAFHRRYYRPDNLIVSIVGNVDSERVLALAEQYLGIVPAAPARPSPASVSGPPPAERPLVIEAPVDRSDILVMYATPRRFAPGSAELELLASFLGNALEARMGGASGPASGVRASHASAALAGLFRLAIRARAGRTVDDVIAALDAALARVSADLDSRQISRLLARTARARLAGVEDRMERAHKLAEAFAITGRTGTLQDELRRQATITVDGARTALAHLKPEVRAVAIVQPTAGAPRSGRLRAPWSQEPPVAPADRASPESGTTAAETSPRSPVRIPAPDTSTATAVRPKDPSITRFVLGNGLKVLISPRHDVPLVRMSLVLPGGDASVPPTLAGLPAATAGVIRRGTKRHPSSLDDGLQDIGMDLAVQTRPAATVASFEVASAHLPRALPLFSDALRSPALDDGGVYDWKKLRLNDCRQDARKPERVAAELLSRNLFVPSSVHAYPADGTVDTVAAIDLAEVRRFHAAHYHPAGATLVVVGDVNPTSLAPLLEQHLGDWTPASRTPVAVPAPKPPQPGPRTLLVDLPAGPHAQIAVATVLPVANEIDRGSARLLQRDLTAQIQRALDTRRLAYDTTVSLSEHASPVLQILVFVPPARAGEAIEAIHQVLRQRGSALQLPAFQRCRERLIDDLAEAASTTAGLASILVDGVVEGVADTFVAARLRSLEAPTPEDVRTLASRAFAPERLLTVVVGDRSVLEPTLRKSGPAPVVANPIVCSGVTAPPIRAPRLRD